jgi:hypothetical protein
VAVRFLTLLPTFVLRLVEADVIGDTGLYGAGSFARIFSLPPM